MRTILACCTALLLTAASARASVRRGKVGGVVAEAGEICAVANDNGGGQVVVSGDKAAVERAGRDEQPSGEKVGGESSEVSRDPAAVARAISGNSESRAYDQVIVGYLLQIVQELRSASGAEAVQLNQRMGELVSEMEPGALARLLEMGGDSGQPGPYDVNEMGLSIAPESETVRVSRQVCPQ